MTLGIPCRQALAVRLMLDRPMRKGYGKDIRDRDETEGTTSNMQWR
jgi:hypothetical protein